ncbi:MAG: alpha/beta fold hydrolase [Actinomycetota bacterium]
MISATFTTVTNGDIDIEAYTIRELAGDAAAVIDALGDGPAIVFGHDWGGAPIAWNTARLHVDMVRAVAGLSVPSRPVTPGDPLDLWRALFTDHGRFFYMVYFQEPDLAEAELGADALRSIRMIYYSASGDAHRAGDPGMTVEKPHGSAMLDGLVDPGPFPAWCSPTSSRCTPTGSTATGGTA